MSEPPSLTPVRIDLAVAAARAGVGLAMLTVPGLAGRPLIGDTAATPGAKLVLRVAGIRDLALAVMEIRALDRPADLPRTRQLSAVVDGTDAVATLIVWRGLASPGKYASLVGGTAAAVHGVLSARHWASENRRRAETGS